MVVPGSSNVACSQHHVVGIIVISRKGDAEIVLEDSTTESSQIIQSDDSRGTQIIGHDGRIQERPSQEGLSSIQTHVGCGWRERHRENR